MSTDTDQAETALDQRNVVDSANQRPEDMGIPTGRLFEHAMEQTRMAICLSDAREPDMPIVFVNQAFEHLTGYDRTEVLGRNCRFMQGPETDPAAVDRIRAALADETVVVVDVLNYRKDGASFWNAVHVGPIFGPDGTLTHFYGSQWDITEIVEQRTKAVADEIVLKEMHHRLGNLFTVLGGLVRVSSRETSDVRTFARLIEARIGALGRAHAASIGQSGPADLHSLVAAVMEPYRSDRDARIGIDGATVRLTPTLVTPMGLVLHELATNALKHGALSRPGGRIAVDWTVAEGALMLVWRETGGPTPDMAGDEPGLGTPMIAAVLDTIGARFAADWQDSGLVGTLTLPL